MSREPDLIYTNGRIYTVDPGQPWTEAIAVKDGKILATGSSETLLADRGPSTDVVDLNGLMVMPGIHDAHVHLLEQSLRNVGIQCSLDSPQTIDELADQLQDYWRHSSHRSWLIAGIYDSQKLTDDLVTRQFLDGLFPDVPVVLYDHTALHVCTVNTTALQLAGIDEGTPDPDGGKVGRAPTGELSGKLYESATAFVRLQAPPYSEQEIDTALEYATATCARYGITSVQEAASYEPLLDGLQRLDARGGLKTHVFAHLLYNFPALGGWGSEGFEDLKNRRETWRSEFVSPDGVKIFLDGTSLPPQYTHVPLDQETGRPVTDNLMIPADTLVDLVRGWTLEGLKVKAHCSGGGAIRVGLDVFEKALSDAGVTARIPHDIAHARWVSDVDLPRFGKNGVVAEMSPTIWHDPAFKNSLEGAFRFASLREAGTLVTIGSDWILPQTPNLFPGLGGIFLREEERVSLDEAIAMLTLNGARSIGKQDQFGSIEAGKDATFIVLDRNLFTSTPEEIQGTKVLSTVVSGEVVFHEDPEGRLDDASAV